MNRAIILIITIFLLNFVNIQHRYNTAKIECPLGTILNDFLGDI